MFLNFLPTVIVFQSEKPVFVRERAANMYDIWIYATTKMIAEIGDIQINVPSSKDDSEIITLAGHKDVVAQAEKYLQKFVKDFEAENFQLEVEIVDFTRNFLDGALEDGPCGQGPSGTSGRSRRPSPPPLTGRTL